VALSIRGGAAESGLHAASQPRNRLHPPTPLPTLAVLPLHCSFRGICSICHCLPSMDPLSVTASIIAILQLSGKVVGYLTDVKDASRERATCAIEVSNLTSLLLNLRFNLEEGNANTPWHTAVQALAFKNGPLEQFKQALETLQTKMTDGGRLKKAGDILMWKFKKEEVDSILGRIGRLKSLVQIALQRDHL
jgi:hypothetical protein